MKIIRNGKEIELTSDELFLAYEEQEHLFDIENIEDNMSEYLDDEQYEKYRENRKFIDFAAYELRRNEDNNMSYESALHKAYITSIEKFERYHKLEEMFL